MPRGLPFRIQFIPSGLTFIITRIPTYRSTTSPSGQAAGIRQLLAGTVDFGASDGPDVDEQLGQAKFKILHFPTVLGAVVPTYNIAGVSGELNFTQKALAGIYLGTITKWNDSEIAKANQGVKLPNADIVVIHRSDGSGTTYIWTDFLAKGQRGMEEESRQGRYFGQLAGGSGRQGQ